jgi:hypothetical protein
MLQDLLKSRRFWVAVASIVAVAFKDKLPFTEAQLTEIAILVSGWLIGESVRSSSAKAPEHA